MNIYSYICFMLRRNISVENMIKVANILKTIGHPLRLEVLEVLEAEEKLNVSQIKEAIQSKVEQSLLSHHLIKMKDKGILQSKKEGMHVVYRITDRNILKIFDCMEKCNF